MRSLLPLLIASTALARGWLVVAPHPDDGVLTSAGVIARAVEEGTPVWVAIVTNGDLGCARDGLRREREAVAALRRLGLDEQHVFFLGYPDGHLAELGETPLTPFEHRLGARCVRDNHTYAEHGFHHRDLHSAERGAPAAYTAADAVADLRMLLTELHPSDVIVTHPADTHPDHAATYALLRRALDGLDQAPRIHRALVHNGDCWPLGDAPHEPCPPLVLAPDQPTPPLTGALAGYLPLERRPVPPAMRVRERNPKLLAIAAHASQTGGSPASYLYAFARSDEAFYPETLERDGDHWVRRGSAHFWATRRDAGSVRHHHAPLALRFGVPPGPAIAIRFLDEYRLSIDPAARTAELARGSRILHRWPLPHDTFAHAESFELRVEPRPEDGDVAELGLYRDGALVGVAIDVHPRRSGNRIGGPVPIQVSQP